MVRLPPLALSAVAGVSAWLSLGVLAVTDDATRARIGALPSMRVLALSVGIACAAALVTRLSLARAWPLALTALLWLPWLPGKIPAAFLIWHGPIVWLVWIAVALGLVFGGRRALAGVESVPALLAHPGRAPWIAGAVAAISALSGAAALGERVPTGDEPHYLIIAQSLLLDGDLRIENNHERRDYLAYFPGALAPDSLHRGLDGQIYSVHAPGVPLLVLPGFAMAGYHGALLTMVLLWGCAMAIVWRAAWRLTDSLSGSAGAAWTAWAAVALTSPGFFHGFTVYPEGVGALGTAAGIWLLVEMEKGARVSTRALVVIGAALALMPWLHSRFALLAAVCGVAIALRLLASGDRGAALARFLSIPALSAVIWFGYFWWIWGTPDPTAPYAHYTQTALRQLWPGLPGVLADQQFGLVSNAPIYAAALVGWLGLARRHPRLAVEIGLLIVPYTLAVASYRMWWAGLSAPARFLVAVLPAAVLPIAWLWSSASRAWRAAMLALLLLSISFVVARLTVDGGALLFNARDGFDLLLDWVNRSVNLPLAMPSLHRDVVSAALVDIFIWALVGLVALGVACHVLTRRQADLAATWAGVCAALAVAAMTASTVVWAKHGGAVITPSTSALVWLQRWSPPWQTIGIQTRPARVVESRDLPARLELASADRGPLPTGVAPLFTAPLVPAGDYDVVIDGSTRPSGRLTVEVGRMRQTLDTWDLAERPPGLTGLTLHLPVLAHSVTITGDEAARHSVSRLTLRPRYIRPPIARLTPDYARRATRYGSVRVFFLDDDAFMEGPGFWTRGNADTTVVIDGHPEPHPDARVRVRAGPVAASLEMTSGEWSHTLALQPGETREVPLPPLRPGQDAWILSLVTGASFRPGDLDSGSQDLRNLGVWVEF